MSQDARVSSNFPPFAPRFTSPNSIAVRLKHMIEMIFCSKCLHLYAEHVLSHDPNGPITSLTAPCFGRRSKSTENGGDVLQFWTTMCKLLNNTHILLQEIGYLSAHFVI